MRTCILLIIAMAAVYAIAVPMVLSDDGYVPIPDISDTRIQDLGQWAVSEADHIYHAHIAFNNVVSGRQKGSSWFDLIINGSRTERAYSNFEALVYQYDKKSVPKLLSFTNARRNILL